MTTMVCFESGGTTYCLPVAVTRAVRLATGIVALPAPSVDVAGLMPGDPALTVLAPLGGGGNQVLIIESKGRSFGLLVDRVQGLRRINDADIRPEPGGQLRSLVCGTLESDGELLLVADVDALAQRL